MNHSLFVIHTQTIINWSVFGGADVLFLLVPALDMDESESDESLDNNVKNPSKAEAVRFFRSFKTKADRDRLYAAIHTRMVPQELRGLMQDTHISPPSENKESLFLGQVISDYEERTPAIDYFNAMYRHKWYDTQPTTYCFAQTPN